MTHAELEPIWVVLFAAAGMMAMWLAWRLWRNGPRRRAERLRERFGPEYDAAVERYGSRRAIRELEARERRVSKLPLRSLAPEEREDFARSWASVQQDFVEDPHEAVQVAHDLLQRTMLARGYPVDAFEQNVADLSVDYGHIVHHYRAAHVLDQANRAGRADTEELRLALIHYRALFEALLGTPTEQVLPASQRYEPALHRAHAPPR